MNCQSRFDAWYRMLCTGVLGWPRSMGRKVGGGFRMGNTCTPVADSCQCMAKPIQYCKLIRLSNITINFHFHALEKEMATHSSVLSWRIPGMGKPGRLRSMGSLRVGHDWVTSLSLFTVMHWRRKWQPTPVFLPGESQGQRSLVGCRLWGHMESDTTEVT